MEVQNRRLIGEILVDMGFISLSKVNEARRKQMVQPNVLLGEYLVDLGYLTPNQLLEALARQADDLRGEVVPRNWEELQREFPAGAMELARLVSLPLFQAIADQLEEGLIIEAWGRGPSEERILFVNRTMAAWVEMEPGSFIGKSERLVVNFFSRFFADPRTFLQRVQDALAGRPRPPATVWKVDKPRPMEVEARTVQLTSRSEEVIGGAIFLKRISAA